MNDEINGERNSEGMNMSSGIKKENKKESFLSSLYDWIEVVSISVIIVIMIFTFVARLSTVDGDSMYPTLIDGERLIVSDLFYSPENGDIVVLQEKNAFFTSPLVKRIIAQEGQTIDFDYENWGVYVDGEKLTEPYINRELEKAMKNYGSPDSITVPEGHIFVMGDNRNHSTDSRDSLVGFVEYDEIIGKVVFRLFPFFPHRCGKINLV